MRILKITLWGAICLFLTHHTLSAQSKQIDRKLKTVLLRDYDPYIDHLEVSWKTGAGDFYIGSGQTPLDTLADPSQITLPLICRLDTSENIDWIHYLNWGTTSLDYVSVKETEGHLALVGQGEDRKTHFIEFDSLGEVVWSLSLPKDSIAAYRSNYSYRNNQNNFDSFGFYSNAGSWLILKGELHTTLLRKEGTLIWNDTLPDYPNYNTQFAEAPDGSLHGLSISRGKDHIHWTSFDSSGTVNHAELGEKRGKWNRKHFLRNKNLTGLYDRNPDRKNAQFFPLEDASGQPAGYLLTATTYNGFKWHQPEQDQGHLLQFIDIEGNPVWTRRYSWPMDIKQVTGTPENLILIRPDGNTEELDSLGFYIRFGESLRETNEIKAKTIAKHDEQELAALEVTTLKRVVQTGQYWNKPAMIVVDSVKRLPPPPMQPVSNTYSSGRSHSGGGGGLGKAIGGLFKAFKGIVEGLGKAFGRHR